VALSCFTAILLPMISCRPADHASDGCTYVGSERVVHSALLMSFFWSLECTMTIIADPIRCTRHHVVERIGFHV
jgi:hypothetical protein